MEPLGGRKRCNGRCSVTHPKGWGLSGVDRRAQGTLADQCTADRFLRCLFFLFRLLLVIVIPVHCRQLGSMENGILKARFNLTAARFCPAPLLGIGTSAHTCIYSAVVLLQMLFHGSVCNLITHCEHFPMGTWVLRQNPT